MYTHAYYFIRKKSICQYIIEEYLENTVSMIHMQCHVGKVWRRNEQFKSKDRLSA